MEKRHTMMIAICLKKCYYYFKFERHILFRVSTAST